MKTGKRSNRRSGFTLIELVVTISILSVVAVIVIPAVRTLNKDRKVRDTARIVGSAFAEARERAAVDGRSGIEMVPLANASGGYNVANMGMLVYQLKAIPPLNGDTPDHVAEITAFTPAMNEATPGSATITFKLNMLPMVPPLLDLSENVGLGDYIELGGSGVWYEITSAPQNQNITIRVPFVAPEPPYNLAPPDYKLLAFRIYRQPIRLESSVTRLPNNLFLNLSWSGHGNDGSQFGLTGPLQPDPLMPGYNVSVRIWFNQDGSIDRVFDRDAAIMVDPNGPLYFLMANGSGDEIDVTSLGDQRFIEDDNNLWIVVDDRNGNVSIGRMAELGAAVTVADKVIASRTLARNRRSANP